MVRFNPRPPISQRATDHRVHAVPHRLVSIHARQFHSGRQRRGDTWPSRIRFQSTPANFTAGDEWHGDSQGSINPFQSTPANFTAGDDAQAGRLGMEAGFQSTPANFTAGDRCSSPSTPQS